MNILSRLALLALLAPAPVFALEAMSDGDLSQHSGQEGIAMFTELRINADTNGQPLTSPSLVANPTAFTNCGSLTNFSSTGCRMALKFANRNDLSGEWLVAKNFYGTIKVPLMYIGASKTPLAPTPYEDLDRFKDENGQPLLASPHGIAALQVEFPEDIEIWNLTIGGLSIEYGASGYLNDAKPVVAGIKISNSIPNTPALISAQGRMSIYGF